MMKFWMRQVRQQVNNGTLFVLVVSVDIFFVVVLEIRSYGFEILSDFSKFLQLGLQAQNLFFHAVLAEFPNFPIVVHDIHALNVAVRSDKTASWGRIVSLRL